MNSVADIQDTFYLQKNDKEGWVREKGVWSYYQDGTVLTGVQQLHSFVSGEEGVFWYDLGIDGTCTEKLTGIFKKDGNSYYARLGVLATGWQSIADADGNSYFYYFDKENGTMLTGYTEADVKGTSRCGQPRCPCADSSDPHAAPRCP